MSPGVPAGQRWDSWNSSCLAAELPAAAKRKSVANRFVAEKLEVPGDKNGEIYGETHDLPSICEKIIWETHGFKPNIYGSMGKSWGNLMVKTSKPKIYG